MKKSFLLAALGVVALGLAACGPTSAIDPNKKYMTGTNPDNFGGITVDAYLLDATNCKFDITCVQEIPGGKIDINAIFDATGTYVVKDNNYTFTVTYQGFSPDPAQPGGNFEGTTTYDAEKKQHTLEYVMSGERPVKVVLTGLLPL